MKQPAAKTAAIREFVQNGCRFHHLRSTGELTEAQQTSERIRLREINCVATISQNLCA